MASTTGRARRLCYDLLRRLVLGLLFSTTINREIARSGCSFDELGLNGGWSWVRTAGLNDVVMFIL